MSKPIVAIVGRPNVGKSTLFNVLAGDNISIVKDTPGVTRDRIYADVEWLNHKFTLVDTGGIEPESKDIILSQMRDQAQIAIDTANVIIFITDVRQGLVDADAKVADMLRRSRKPVVLVVNKVDNFDRQMMDVYEFYNLGIGEPHAISASGKLGIGDMLDEVTGYFDPEMRRARFRASPLSENRTSENPPWSTNCWARTVSSYPISPERRAMRSIPRSCTMEMNIFSSIPQVFERKTRSKRSWSGTASSVQYLP